jgi:hypothetical protein
MTSKERIYQSAKLLLRDDKGNPNKNALEVFNATYRTARNEKLSVQSAGELAIKAALGK